MITKRLRPIARFMLAGVVALSLTERSTYSEDEKLPSDAKILLNKLAAFEEEEREKLETTLREKRKQVAEVLTKLQERETKAGNLDAGLTLREKIEALTGSAKAPSTTETTSLEPGAAPPQDWYIGQTWAVEGAPQEYTLNEGGSVAKLYKGQLMTTDYKWSLQKSGALKVEGENNPMYFWLDSASKGEMSLAEIRVDGVKLERR